MNVEQKLMLCINQVRELTCMYLLLNYKIEIKII